MQFETYPPYPDPDNHDGVITHLEPDILECEVKWALGSIAATAAKPLQSCLTLCNAIDGSPPGPPRPRPWDSPGKNTGMGCHFLLQCMKVKSENEVAQSYRLLATPWTAAYQAPPAMGFSN